MQDGASHDEEGVDPEDEYQSAVPLRKPRLFAYDWAKGFVSPYRPADEAVVHSVLELVSPGEDDVVYDLGSGDGRFLLAFAAAVRAAREAHGERNSERREPAVVGYELDAALASLSRDHATAAGLARLVEADLSPASIIVAYLLPDALRSLVPKLLYFLDSSPQKVVVTISWALPEEYRTDAYIATHLISTTGAPLPHTDPTALSSADSAKERFARMGFYVYGRRVIQGSVEPASAQ